MRQSSPAVAGSVLAVLLMAVPAGRAFEPPADDATKQRESPEQAQWKAKKVEAKRQQVDAVAGETLEKLFAGNPKAKTLHEKAFGYAVFDNMKFGFFVSGGGGKGVAVEKSTGKRTYMTMGTAGVGLSFGGQKYQVVFLFQDESTFRRFVDDGWAADASARAAAGKEGGAAGTHFVNGLAIYQMNEKGLMASADIAGTKYSKDDELN